MTPVCLFANLLVIMHFPCIEKFSHYFQIEIPMWFAPPVWMLGTQPGQELFQLRTLSGKLNAVFVGNVLLQFFVRKTLSATSFLYFRWSVCS